MSSAGNNNGGDTSSARQKRKANAKIMLRCMKLTISGPDQIHAMGGLFKPSFSVYSVQRPLDGWTIATAGGLYQETIKMKRSLLMLGITGLMGWLVFVCPVNAQPSKEAEATDTDEGKKDKPDEADLISAARRHVGLLTKLHEKMEAKLDLSDEQKRAVDELFRDHLKKLKDARSQRRADKAAAVRADEMAELREKMKEARDAGDKDTVNELRKKMRDILKEQRGGVTKGTSEFLGNVRDELEENQVKWFESMVRELGLDLDEGPGITVQQLLKAVLSPEIGLSSDQRKAVLDRMRGALLGMDSDARDAGDLDDISPQLRADLRAQLTEAQWTKVEEQIKADAEANKANEKKSERPGERRPPAKAAEEEEESDE